MGGALVVGPLSLTARRMGVEDCVGTANVDAVSVTPVFVSEGDLSSLFSTDCFRLDCSATDAFFCSEDLLSSSPSTSVAVVCGSWEVVPPFVSLILLFAFFVSCCVLAFSSVAIGGGSVEDVRRGSFQLPPKPKLLFVAVDRTGLSGALKEGLITNKVSLAFCRQ